MFCTQFTGKDIENKEEYYNVLTEFLLMTKGGQVYIKDIKFNKIPINNYNITVSDFMWVYVEYLNHDTGSNR